VTRGQGTDRMQRKKHRGKGTRRRKISCPLNPEEKTEPKSLFFKTKGEGNRLTGFAALPGKEKKKKKKRKWGAPKKQ